MKFADWEPVYEAILSDFGFDRAGDEYARDVLGQKTRPFDLDWFDSVRGMTVGIAGAAPSLLADVGRLKAADLVMAASNAAGVLAEAGVRVDCVVTDLDKAPEQAVSFTHEEVPVVVLAHGDNLEFVTAWVPQCNLTWVMPTTQARPCGHVLNFGGFTDGDRAAFLADAFEAESLVFAGWEFDDDSVGKMKRRKLEWAERLLHWLEICRDERFSILDGRRAGIDTSHLPV